MDGGCDWICDCCGAYMNIQPGFDVSDGTWVCSECGEMNDVSGNNILDLLGMALNGISEFITRTSEPPDEDD